MSNEQDPPPPSTPRPSTPRPATPSTPRPAPPASSSRASYRLGYFLCLFLGWLGAHRYYLRLWGTGAIYSVAACAAIGFFKAEYFSAAYVTLGLLAFAVLFDLLTLPLLVRQRRDLQAGIPLPPDKAPWADDEDKTWWGRFQVLLRFAILVFVPALTIVIARSLGQPVIVALVFMLLAFSLLVGSIGRGLYALEDMKSFTQRVPLLPVAIDIVTRFQNHYFEHRTRSVFYYLFYPVFGPVSVIFSRSARSEFRPFLSLFSLVVFAVLFQNLISYLKIFPLGEFEHNLTFGFWVCLTLAAGGIALFFMCVVPIVSSSFYMSMTGRGFSLRVSAALGLVISGVAILVITSTTSVTFRGALTGMEKFNNTKFRDDFNWLNMAFLKHEMSDPAHNKYNLSAKKLIWAEIVSDPTADVHILPDSTDWYRSFMASKLRPEEAAAYTVLAIDPPEDDTSDATSDETGQAQIWLAVLFTPDPVGFGGFMGEAMLLFVISPDYEIFSKWEYLHENAPWFADRFEIVSRKDFNIKLFPNELTTYGLIEDIDFGSEGKEKRGIPSLGSWRGNLNKLRTDGTGGISGEPQH